MEIKALEKAMVLCPLNCGTPFVKYTSMAITLLVECHWWPPSKVKSPTTARLICFTTLQW